MLTQSLHWLHSQYEFHLQTQSHLLAVVLQHYKAHGESRRRLYWCHPHQGAK